MVWRRVCGETVSREGLARPRGGVGVAGDDTANGVSPERASARPGEQRGGVESRAFAEPRR